MGSVAAISGGLGRAMSPVAAGAIMCAGLAGVNPLEIAKRNAPRMIVAVTVLMIFMLYILSPGYGYGIDAFHVRRY